MSTTQLRLYKTHPEHLDSWARLFVDKITPFRSTFGFEVTGRWKATERDTFVWILHHPGTQEEFEAAEKAYYEHPGHLPLHEEALGYLVSAETFFMDDV